MCAQVVSVITRERVDITDIVNAAAAAHDCPAVLLVACGIAESQLSAQAAREAAWPDVSYSIWQEAVKWAAAYGVGDGQDTPANRALVRNILSTDLARAADIAAQQLGQYWQRTHDPLQSLYLYNWPGGGGQPASAETAQNYRRGWNAAQFYLAADEEPPVYTPQLDHDHGTVAGTFAGTPQGIILHGSRSGIAGRSIADEYDGTRRYAASGIELGWSATVGDDAISLHMSPRAWGWNARGASSRYLAVELAQPTVHDPITDGQVRALCWWIQQVVVPAWPDLDVTSLPTHAELPEGQGDGKSDCFPRGDARADELRARIAARLAGDTDPNGGDDLSAAERATLEWWQGVAPVLPGFLNTVEDEATALAQRTRGANHEAAAAILAQLTSFRQVSGYKREELETD